MINMLRTLVEIAPYMYRVSHVNNNIYLCLVVTSQLYVEITYLFYDYEITLFMLSFSKIYASYNISYQHDLLKYADSYS